MKISLKIEKLTSSEKVFFFAYALYLIPQIIDLSFYKRYTGNAVRDLIAVALIILVMREFIFESKTYNKRGINCWSNFCRIDWYYLVYRSRLWNRAEGYRHHAHFCIRCKKDTIQEDMHNDVVGNDSIVSVHYPKLLFGHH